MRNPFLGRGVAFLLTSLLSSSLAAATFTVGAGGSHGSIQGAINAALLAGGENEIRVRRGTWNQDLTVSSDMDGGSLSITGGWNAGFTSRDGDPAVTIVNAGGSGSALTVASSGGTLTISGFTFTNGAPGLSMDPTGGIVEISGNIIDGNHVTLADSASGGGMRALARGSSQLRILGNTITSNTATSTGSSAAGAGAYITTQDSATLSFNSNTVENNVAEAPTNQATGAGIYFTIAGTGSFEFLDNFILENQTLTTSGNSATFPGGVIGSSSTADNTATIARNEIRGNISNYEFSTEQFAVISDGTSTFRVSDSLFAGGSGGLMLWDRGTSVLQATNLTAADNDTYGLRTIRTGGGQQTVFNSIFFGNGTDTWLDPGTTTGSNLVGVDPLFVDPASSNYRLTSGSPAVNAGTNSPPGGLSATDLAEEPRISGGTVDIGAYEFDGPAGFDPNGDGVVTASDVFYLINFLFATGADPVGGADANGDGSVTASDVFFLINYLFAGGPAPA